MILNGKSYFIFGVGKGKKLNLIFFLYLLVFGGVYLCLIIFIKEKNEIKKLCCRLIIISFCICLIRVYIFFLI